MEQEREVLKSESGEENVNDSIDYIEAIKEMKQNSVSKESYEKVKQENKKLMDALLTTSRLKHPRRERLM